MTTAALDLGVGAVLLGVSVFAKPHGLAKRTGQSGGTRRPRSAPVTSASGLSIRALLGRPGVTAEGSRWANKHDLESLLSDRRSEGRLSLGIPLGFPTRRRLRFFGRSRSHPASPLILKAEHAQSLTVIGPSQSGKTSSLAIPAILEWHGPVVAASVKVDLMAETVGWRSRIGHITCFDPAGTTGFPSDRWSPLPAARTWRGALKVAADLTDGVRGAGTSTDGDFWYSAAAKLLAPLLFAAANAECSIHDVIRWVDTQETTEVLAAIERTGIDEAIDAVWATWHRDDRQRSAVYTTVETVLQPFAELQPVAGLPTAGVHPIMANPHDRVFRDALTPPYGSPVVSKQGETGRARLPDVRTGGEIDVAGLFEGEHTLYICAPAHDQRRLRGLFTALVKQVIEEAFGRVARTGSPLDPGLLIVLDEAANIAPLDDLDGLAATCAGHGVQLITVWQDIAQITARYGERASTVVNNHRAKMFLSGISDLRTLEHASTLIGDERCKVKSSTEGGGSRTTTTSTVDRRLLPPDALRRLPDGNGVLVYGALPPARVRLRPWFFDPVLKERGNLKSGTLLSGPGPRPADQRSATVSGP